MTSSKAKAWLHACFLASLVTGIWGGTGAFSAPVSPTQIAEQAASPPRVRLLRDGPTGLWIEWTSPPLQVRPVGDDRVEIVAPGYQQTGQFGTPRLPFTATLIALPLGAVPRLHVSSVEEDDRLLPAPVAAAPRPEGIIQDGQGHPIGGAFVPEVSAVHAGPASPVVLEEIGIVRGVRLARLVFYPARPEGDRLRVVRHLRAEVRWSPAVAGGSDQTPPPAPSDPVLDLLRRQVFNPRDVRPVARSSAGDSLQPAESTGPVAFVEAEHPGIYRVTYADLAPLGLTSADPQNLRLFQGDDEVAIEWQGDADAAFEPGESLLFYAEPRFSRWTWADAYRLVTAATPGRRMATRSANPAGLPADVPWVEQVIEENHIYTPDCFCGSLPPGRDGDHWTWEMLRRPDRATVSAPFQAQAADAGQSATLTLWLIGYTDLSANPDHRIDVSVNGTPLGRVEWDGRQAVTATLTIPVGTLHGGQNILGLSLPGIPGVNVEGAWLDAFAVRYGRSQQAAGTSVRFGVAPAVPREPATALPRRTYLPLIVYNLFPDGAARAYTVSLEGPGPYRAYDVTNPFSPQRLTAARVSGSTVTVGDPLGGTPRRYFVTSDADIQRPVRVRALESLVGQGSALTGADVLIITHPAFAGALGPLVSLRQSQGLTVSVVNVLGIYDAYGDGRPDSEAIRSFVADAYVTWTPRPTYVLLVGDGSFDPRRYRTESSATFIPPYLADVDPWAGETAADNRYACVDGADYLPDLFIGRLPVQTLEQARAVVEKVVQYEARPLPGDWNADVLLVADDADVAGDFAGSSESQAAAHVTSPFTTTPLYCTGTSPYTSDCPSQEAAKLTAALMNDWNQGALLVQFTGHSSWQQWAAERFFHLDDLGGLYNGQRLPVVVEMTCFTGSFHRPEPTLDESLVTLTSRGAVAAWGPTGLGVGTGHASLSDGFFRALFTESVRRVGEATLAGKLALATSGQHLDLLDTFTLLGDPALDLNLALVPWAYEVFLPVALRGG
jgi:hypothetical protein